jgi:hypothetical protein
MRRHEAVAMMRTMALNLIRELGESDITRRLFVDAASEAYNAAKTLYACECEETTEPVNLERLVS